MTEFRPMRRCKQELSKDRVIEVLERGTSGVLAVSGDNGYPYAVPLSYVYDDDKVYFHCAKSGHKVDAIKNCDKVSFCVIDADDVKGEEFTTYFRSVIAFGRAREVEKGSDEYMQALNKLALKYWNCAPQDKIDAEIAKNNMPQVVYAIEIEHLSGKEAIELLK